MAVSADSLMPEHLAETAGELFPAEEYISGDNLKGKKLIICCTHGTNSIPLAERFAELGYDAASLKAVIYHGCSTPWASRSRLTYVPMWRRASAKSSTRRYGATSQRPSIDMNW